MSSQRLRHDGDLGDALRRVDEVAARAEAVRDEFLVALLAANEAGASTRKLAPHARLSHNRVAELIREAKQRARDEGEHIALLATCAVCICCVLDHVHRALGCLYLPF